MVNRLPRPQPSFRLVNLGALVALLGLLCLPVAVPRLAAADTASWKPGDKLEVKWGNQWYPAEILEAKDDTCKIHYVGYGSNWDEWVGPDRMRPAASSHAPEAAPAAGAWKVGDRVDAWNVAWYPAEILEIGTGDRAGYYRVHYVNFSAASDQWLKADSIRGSTAAPTPSAASTDDAAVPAPRLGRYAVFSTGPNGQQIALGELELQAKGRYLVRLPGGRVRGEGTYAFDTPSATVKWLTGPYQEDGFGGKVEVSRAGRTHLIRLLRSTVATNSKE